jgi:hypothetical protein
MSHVCARPHRDRVSEDGGEGVDVVQGCVCLPCYVSKKRKLTVIITGTGSWRAQRSITRTNVTALKFIDDGDALLGGTRDGVLCAAKSLPTLFVV